MTTYQTTKELDDIRAWALSGDVIPKETMSVMLAETEALRKAGVGQNAIKKGDKAPDFILPDAQGHVVRLKSFLEHSAVVLVFYRGGWCPYCNAHLRGFQRILPEFQKAGAQILAVSPQLPDNSLSTQEKDELKYPVLSDVGNKVAREYGIDFTLSPELLQIYKGFGHALDLLNGPDGSKQLPVPATFLIGKDGIVIHADVDLDYTRRVDPEELLQKIGR